MKAWKRSALVALGTLCACGVVPEGLGAKQDELKASLRGDDGSSGTEALGPTQRQPVIAPRCSNDADCVRGRNTCTTGKCTSGVCAYTIVVTPGGSCDDGNPCTTNDTCTAGGGCAGTPSSAGSCDDGNACTTADSCVQGACVGTPTPGAPCSDGSACTLSDTCTTAGLCVGQTEVVILTGSNMPDLEGWQPWGADTVAATSVTPQPAVQVNTVPLQSQAYAVWSHPLPANFYATHDVVWNMQVTSVSVVYDPPLPPRVTWRFFPDHSGWFGVYADGMQSMTLDTGWVNWGDFSSADYLVDTTLPHEYRFSATPSGASIYVDGTLALLRNSFNPTQSRIAFGDIQNQSGYQANVKLWNVRLSARPDCL